MQTTGITLLIGAALLLAIWYLKRSTRALEQSKISMDFFYESANALTGDGRTPFVVLAMLSEMSNDLTDGSIMRKFIFQVFWRRAFFSESRVSSQSKDLHATVMELPPELQGHFFRAIVAALFTISFRSFIFGPIFRRLMMVGVELAKRSGDQQRDSRVETYAAGLFGHDHHNGRCAIAA